MKQILSFLLLFICLQLNAQSNGDSLINATMARAWQYMNSGRQNAGKAMELFTRCAVQGNPEAMNALGVQYKTGFGVTPDSQKAVEWFAKAATAGYTKAWYNLGLGYKDALDFTHAFACFDKAAGLHDTQSEYAKGYMLYKGLGCTQNYSEAVRLFARGAVSDKPNCMYFYGLCLRNGYGVPTNKDSARYWLLQAAGLGYHMAADELMIKDPEYVQEAGLLAAKIQATRQIITKNKVSNLRQKVKNQIPQENLAGIYNGYLLKYDWSGQHVVEANKLNISLNCNHDSVTGVWIEDDILTLPIKALLTSGTLVFSEMQYSKTSHYSTGQPELYIFEKAHVQLSRSKDGVYLSGTIQQFIPCRNEPAKPLFIALKRTVALTSAANINPVNKTAILIK